MIGEKTGGLNDYHKDGASTSPNSVFADANFGSVNMTALGSAGGYNAPFLLENVEMTGYNMLGEKVWNGNSRNSIRESIDLTLLKAESIASTFVLRTRLPPNGLLFRANGQS